MSGQITYTVEDIAELMRSAKSSGQPYVFFTGAGCSVSAGIPLASKLIQEICEKYSIQVKTLSPETRKDYGKCMAQLTKDERRTIIKPYVDNAKINWAHIALACLMDAGYVTRVLTFNFDNILARSCGLLGLYPATYDFTSANINLHNLIVEPAIVHLHGQSHGFTQLNSADETDIHAKNLSEFIRTTLNHSPSLFIGYSGSADAFFTQLENKFDGEQRLIWIDYELSPNEHVKKFLEENKGTSHHIGGQDADEFLISLAQKLDCFPPQLFQNPYAHLIDELEDVIEFPMQANSSMDILKSTRIKLEADSKKITDNLEQNLELLLLEGKYDEVIKYAKNIDLSDDDKDKIAWSYIVQGNILSEMAKEKGDESFYRESIEKYEQAVAIKSNMYAAWNNWGVALADLARQKGDELLYRESFEKYEQAVTIKSDAPEVWVNWGVSLADLAKQKGDEPLYRESFEKYEYAITLKSNMHEAWNNWGIALANLAKQNKDESLYKESFEKYEHATTLKSNMQEAWNNWGIALSDLAEQKGDEFLYIESFMKYEKAVLINPDMSGVWNNWATALLNCVELTNNEVYLEEAMKKSKKAESINPDNVYNLACVLSRKKDTEGCRQKLLHAKLVGTLPDINYLLSDADLENVRHLSWFQELVEA